MRSRRRSVPLAVCALACLLLVAPAAAGAVPGPGSATSDRGGSHTAAAGPGAVAAVDGGPRTVRAGAGVPSVADPVRSLRAVAGDGTATTLDSLRRTLANQAPTADAGGPYTVDEGAAITLDGSGSSDPDSDSLTYKWDLDGDGMYEATGPQVTFDAAGIDGPTDRMVTLRVTDGNGGSNTDSTTVSVSNVAPSASIDSLPGPADEGQSVSLSASFTDAGGVDTHSATVKWGDGTEESVTVDPSTDSLSASHTYPDNGRYTVTVTVTDDDGASSTTSSTVSVSNVAPSASIDSLPTSPDEGQSISLDGSVTDPGTDDDHLASVEWGDGNSDSVTVGRAADTFSWSHTYADDGSYTVTVTVTDDEGASSTTSSTVSVSNVAPTFETGSPALTVPEDASATGIDGLLGVTDPATGETLEWSVATAPAGTPGGFPTAASSTGGSVAPSGLTYAPAADDDGSDDFDVQVSDGTDTSVVTVDVTVQDAPEVASVTRADPSSPTDADGLTFDVTFSESVTGVSADDVTATTVSGDATGSVASVSSSSGTTVTVTVDGVSGDGDLRLDVVDDDGITDGDGVPLGGVGTGGAGDGGYTAGEAFTVDNTAPTFAAGTSNAATVDEGTTGSVLDVEADDDTGTAYDTDVTYALGGPDAGPFSIDAATGQLSLDSPQDFEEPADGDGDGVYDLTVTATDDVGLASTQTVAVTVADVNEPPTATADEDGTDQYSSVDRPAAGVLADDTDPDGDALSVGQVDGRAGAVGATVAGSNGGEFRIRADGSYSFDPADDFLDLRPTETRETSVSYGATDGAGATDTATLTVTVEGVVVEEPTADPTARDDGDSTDEDTVVSRDAAAGVLANDSDPEGNALAVDSVRRRRGLVGERVAGSDGGRFVVQRNGSYRFDPAGDFDDLAPGERRTTGVRYRVRDGAGGTDTARLTVTVEGAEPPTARPDSYEVAEGAILTVDAAAGVLANDTTGDSSAGNLSATVVERPDRGALSLAGDGSFRYVPAAALDGTDTFVYRVTGDGGETDRATVTVTERNRPPVPEVRTPAFVVSGEPVELDATGTTDPDGDGVTYEWTQTGGPGVDLAEQSDGVATFTAPPVDILAVVTVEVTVDDGRASRTATVPLLVAAGGGDGTAEPDGESDPKTSEDSTAPEDSTGPEGG